MVDIITSMNTTAPVAYAPLAAAGQFPEDKLVIGGTEAVLSSVPEVPEPETYAMLALGLLGVGFAVRRQAARV
jgi:hypothetical protein